jgi:hypothetical protein
MKSIHAITLEELESEARWQGYTMETGEATVRCIRQGRRSIVRTFSLGPDETVPPRLAPSYGIIQAYFWVRGYDLRYEDELITLERGRQHPGYNRRVPVGTSIRYWEYRDLDALISALSGWVIEEAERSWQIHHYWRARRRKRALGVVCLYGGALFILILVGTLVLRTLQRRTRCASEQPGRDETKRIVRQAMRG